MILDSPILDELGRTSLLKPPLFLVFVIKIVDTSKFPAAEGVVQREIETLLVVSTRKLSLPMTKDHPLLPLAPLVLD